MQSFGLLHIVSIYFFGTRNKKYTSNLNICDETHYSAVSKTTSRFLYKTRSGQLTVLTDKYCFFHILKMLRGKKKHTMVFVLIKHVVSMDNFENVLGDAWRMGFEVFECESALKKKKNKRNAFSTKWTIIMYT